MSRTPRTPRNLQSRENEARTVYVPPSNLPDPEPRPGIVHRWVSLAVLGQPNVTHTQQRFREGWVPVKAEDYPEMQMMQAPSGNIEVGGLVLCAMPKELADARARYYAQQTQNQMEAVDQTYMREEDSRMPLVNETKSSKVSRGTFGSGE